MARFDEKVKPFRMNPAPTLEPDSGSGYDTQLVAPPVSRHGYRYFSLSTCILRLCCQLGGTTRSSHTTNEPYPSSNGLRWQKLCPVRTKKSSIFLTRFWNIDLSLCRVKIGCCCQKKKCLRQEDESIEPWRRQNGSLVLELRRRKVFS